MGVKSHPSPVIVPRKPRSIVKEYIQPKTCYYKNLTDLKNKIGKIKLDGWNVVYKEDDIFLTFNSKSIGVYVPYLKILIDSGLGFTVQIYGWYLPEDHIIYRKNKRSMKNIIVSNMVATCLQFKLCEGVKSKDGDTSSLVCHSIPKTSEEISKTQNPDKALVPYAAMTFFRSNNCDILVDSEDLSPNGVQCIECIDCELKKQKRSEISMKNVNKPASLKAPISVTNINRVKLTLQQQRLKCSQLEKKIEEMKKALENTKCPIVDGELSSDFVSIFNKNRQHVSPFMELFWQQQQRMFRCSPRGTRYHPMVIRFCLSLYAKSSSSYEEIRNSGWYLETPFYKNLKGL